MNSVSPSLPHRAHAGKYYRSPLAKEARLAVVAALHDVQEYPIEVNTRAAGHAIHHKYIEPGLA